ncbi:LysR family transcriptional regulator [Solimonas sp. K1W22B-7]|uniref:LysR substrate-binding domain-containing protein n=1 Tax=Solimonas sp. K1W22B-7 TaxID=2303331 RepID=UPI000E330F19|nr:LysR substrate-binding domain-containing protein [Solimonas sp. K1W22B-7]AXQ31852.1 LysR family transcriptional regulator [Solimonas sp. K1W22B-7]
MNLNHLSIFQAVAASGSISGGARELHISQSAVSKQLAEFERALGVLLLDRLPRGVRPTEAGRLLLGYANRLFAIEAEAAQALGDLQQLGRGRLAIGASRTIGGYMLPDTLAAFRRRHPGVELSLQVENTQAIEAKLLAGEIDIGFAEGIVSSGLLDYQVFAEDELVLIAAPGHPLASGAALSLAALAGCPLLMHEVGSGTRAVTERALAAKNIRLRPAMTLASTEAIKHTVATGVALAFLSAQAVRTELKAGTLGVVEVKGLRIRRPLYRVQLKSAWLSPALEAFLGFLPDR